jgi:2Fe-2S ferredoxin
MVRVTFIGADGTAREVATEAGQSVMRAAVESGIGGILGDCGGALSCATCHVHVSPKWMDRVGCPGDNEAVMLEMTIDPDETSRLSCQIILGDELDGLVVRLPHSQL